MKREETGRENNKRTSLLSFFDNNKNGPQIIQDAYSYYPHRINGIFDINVGETRKDDGRGGDSDDDYGGSVEQTRQLLLLRAGIVKEKLGTERNRKYYKWRS